MQYKLETSKTKDIHKQAKGTGSLENRISKPLKKIKIVIKKPTMVMRGTKTDKVPNLTQSRYKQKLTTEAHSRENWSQKLAS